MVMANTSSPVGINIFSDSAHSTFVSASSSQVHDLKLRYVYNGTVYRYFKADAVTIAAREALYLTATDGILTNVPGGMFVGYATVAATSGMYLWVACGGVCLGKKGTIGTNLNTTIVVGGAAGSTGTTFGVSMGSTLTKISRGVYQATQTSASTSANITAFIFDIFAGSD